MKIQIFDVEHGGCALLTADNGSRMLIDCGHNSSTGWRPSAYLRAMGVRHLERLMITNYDEDHASDLVGLLKTVTVGVLHSNPTVSGDDLRKLKRSGGIGPGIDALADLKNQYTASVSGGPDNSGYSIQSFYSNYDTDFEDENNLSLVSIIRGHGITICFPGDTEVAGWKNLLRNPRFCSAISQVNVFVASHHGRQNGCCDELYSVAGLNPYVTIISDSGIQYASQETIGWYRNRTRGFTLNGENRHVLTTRRDGRVLLQADSSAWTVSVGSV